MKVFYTILSICFLFFYSCDRNGDYITDQPKVNIDQEHKPTDGIGNNGDISDDAGLVVGLKLESDMVFENVHIFVFNSKGRLHRHVYHSTPESLSLGLIILDEGEYNVVVVMNLGEFFDPHVTRLSTLSTVDYSNLTFAELLILLDEKIQSGDYPNLAASMTTISLNALNTDVVFFDMKRTIETIAVGILDLSFTYKTIHYPKSSLPQRVTVEVWDKSDSKLTLRYSNFFVGSGLELFLLPGDYEVLVWVDHVSPDYAPSYIVDNLKFLKLNYDLKSSDFQRRDAYCTTFDITMESTKVNHSIELVRPFGYYEVYTTDIEDYIAKYSYEPKDNFIIPRWTRFTSQSYFPTEYNVRTGVANGFSLNKQYYFGIGSDITENGLLIASGVVFSDKKATYIYGVEVYTADRVKINTIANQSTSINTHAMTIIKGEFLTKDSGTGDIGIDDGFDDEIIIPVPDF